MSDRSVSSHRFSQIRVGKTVRKRYVLTKDVYQRFLELFGDVNPLHVSDAFAKKKGFKSKVMHGAILHGFVSHFIGTYFPGKHALLRSVNMQYRAPVYQGDALFLVGKVEHVSVGTRTLLIDLSCVHATSKKLVATSKVQVGVTA